MCVRVLTSVVQIITGICRDLLLCTGIQTLTRTLFQTFLCKKLTPSENPTPPLRTRRVGPGHPLSPLSLHFPVFCSFLLFPSLLRFNYFLLLSIPFLSTRIVPLRFQAGGRRKRPNLGLVCCVYFVCIP